MMSDGGLITEAENAYREAIRYSYTLYNMVNYYYVHVALYVHTGIYTHRDTCVQKIMLSLKAHVYT